MRALLSLLPLACATACSTDGNWEAGNEPPDACCPAEAPKFYACVVELQAGTSAVAPGTVPAPFTMAQCSPSLDAAHQQAVTLALASDPGVVAGEASCEPIGCPGDTTDEAVTAADGGS